MAAGVGTNQLVVREMRNLTSSVVSLALIIASIVVAVIGVPLAASMYLALLAIWVLLFAGRYNF